VKLTLRLFGRFIRVSDAAGRRRVGRRAQAGRLRCGPRSPGKGRAPPPWVKATGRVQGRLARAGHRRGARQATTCSRAPSSFGSLRMRSSHVSSPSLSRLRTGEPIVALASGGGGVPTAGGHGACATEPVVLASHLHRCPSDKFTSKTCAQNLYASAPASERTSGFASSAPTPSMSDA